MLVVAAAALPVGYSDACVYHLGFADWVRAENCAIIQRVTALFYLAVLLIFVFIRGEPT